MAAIIRLDEHQDTTVYEVGNGEPDEDGVVWSWEMTGEGTSVRLAVTDEGTLIVALDRDMVEAGEVRTRSVAVYLEGERISRFASATDAANWVADRQS